MLQSWRSATSGSSPTSTSLSCPLTPNRGSNLSWLRVATPLLLTVNKMTLMHNSYPKRFWTLEALKKRPSDPGPISIWTHSHFSRITKWCLSRTPVKMRRRFPTPQSALNLSQKKASIWAVARVLISRKFRSITNRKMSKITNSMSFTAASSKRKREIMTQILGLTEWLKHWKLTAAAALGLLIIIGHGIKLLRKRKRCQLKQIEWMNPNFSRTQFKRDLEMT